MRSELGGRRLEGDKSRNSGTHTQRVTLSVACVIFERPLFDFKTDMAFACILFGGDYFPPLACK